MPSQPSRIKVVRIDLAEQLRDIEVGEGYAAMRALVCVAGTPAGYATAPVTRGRCTAGQLANVIAAQLGPAVLRACTYHRLGSPVEQLGVPPAALLAAGRTRGADRAAAPLPFITVAVCTRDRPAPLAECLRALRAQEYPADAYEVVVVDNAPSTEATAELLRDQHGWARYVREPRPGLDWARNRAIAEARGEIIAYTDDDVIVEPDWLQAYARGFAEAPDAACVTGLVVPHSLDTEAEQLFERYGGFGRGWARRWTAYPHHLPPGSAHHHGAGQFGTGANMAFRRSALAEIGGFDPAMDVGTPTNGGGDLEMYFRVVQEGRVIVYDPRVMVRHQHRTDLPGLYRQIRDWGTGFYCYVLCAVDRYPEEAAAFAALRRWWTRSYVARRALRGLLAPWRANYPLSLVLEEPRGARVARARYRAARARVRSLEADPAFGPPPAVLLPAIPAVRSAAVPTLPRSALAVRTVDLSAPLAPVEDVGGSARTRVYFTLAGVPIGMEDIPNGGGPIVAARLREAAAGVLASYATRHSTAPTGALVRAWALGEGSAPRGGAGLLLRPIETDGTPPASASVVIATRDRPEDLRRCLTSLAAQRTTRRLEVVVVDNNPASGLTAAVAAEFPAVRVHDEPRPGLSFARNAGVRHASGDVVLMTDDDVTVPPEWVERVTAPFADPSVGAVTGNVLPRELDTLAQQAFEHYGGLGRGFDRRRADPEWLRRSRKHPARTWDLGATANAAFRRALFSDPAVGYLDEALGAGTPTGCSEDTDLFYRVLAAGWSMVYEPGAYVWHTHRRESAALERQIFGYSKGHVAYHLTTLVRYRDPRAIYHLAWVLPMWHARKIVSSLLGRGRYPLRLTLVEVAGNLAGPLALLRSRSRARQLRAEGAAPARESGPAV